MDDRPLDRVVAPLQRPYDPVVGRLSEEVSPPLRRTVRPVLEDVEVVAVTAHGLPVVLEDVGEEVDFAPGVVVGGRDVPVPVVAGFVPWVVSSWVGLGYVSSPTSRSGSSETPSGLTLPGDWCPLMSQRDVSFWD